MAAAAASDPPKYAILTYDYVPDILEKRGPYRAEHLAAAQKLVRPVCGHYGACLSTTG